MPRGRADFILTCAKTLYVNGQASDQIALAVERLCRSFNLSGTILFRWGELTLDVREDDRRFVAPIEATPAGVDMERVVATTRLVADLTAGRLAFEAAPAALDRIVASRPAATWLFVMAAGLGAVALSVLFGVQHWPAVALIFASAAAGAAMRRWLARYSTNIFVQPFVAALLAGLVGGLAERYGLSSALRLVAVCPCMVLVPGPHFLNGALDLLEGRIHLGFDRMLYAGLVVLAISIGLLLGLSLLGVSLPVDEPGRAVPLWQDIAAAGVAVAAYSVFFSTPPKMLAWPVAIGMIAHALRWYALSAFGASTAAGALLACVLVGCVLTPVARRWHMPFAAIGFASVVSMIPGVFLFRMASGLLQIAYGGAQTAPDLVTATLNDGIQAAIIIVAIAFGLIVPRLMIDRLWPPSLRTAPRG